jgi:hypothetical protein
VTTSQLQDLTDRAELTRLMCAIGRSLDEHRFDDLHEIFTQDVTATLIEGTDTGRDKLVAVARANHQDYDRLQHHVTSVMIDMDGDRAEVRANLEATFGYKADPRPVRQLGGLYRGTAVRTEEGWRFSQFQVTPIWRVEREGTGE